MRRGARGRSLYLLVAAAFVLGVGGVLGSTLWATRPSADVTATPLAASPAVDGSAPSTPAAVVHLVGLGDSVMSGMNCSCRGIVAEYADRLARDTGQKVVGTNLGVPGATTQDLLTDVRQDPQTESAVRDADVVVVIIGANDLGDALDTWQSSDCDDTCYLPDVAGMKRRLSDILSRIAQLNGARHAPVLVADYWNVFTDGEVARNAGGPAQLAFSADVTKAVNQAIAEAVKDHQARLVDLVQPFKGSSGTADPTGLLADDGDHPNAAGVRAIVDSLALVYP